MVTLVFTLLGLAGWGLAHQMDSLAQDLPRYRGNILTKIADVRVAGQGGSVEKLQEAIADITARLGRSNQPEGTAARPIVVTSQPIAGLPGLTSWLSPIVGPLGTAGLVVAMVIFMLVERRALRDRLIGFFGHGHLAMTTRAIDEAGQRVSRQLLMQSLVNLLYGIAAGVGLALLGVPYALVWAALGAACASSRTSGRCSAPARRSWSASPRCRGGPDRSASWRCSWCSSCSPTSCSRPCCMPAPRACPRSRCSCRWRSGPGCGARSACSWPRR